MWKKLGVFLSVIVKTRSGCFVWMDLWIKRDLDHFNSSRKPLLMVSRQNQDGLYLTSWIRIYSISVLEDAIFILCRLNLNFHSQWVYKLKFVGMLYIFSSKYICWSFSILVFPETFKKLWRIPHRHLIDIVKQNEQFLIHEVFSVVPEVWFIWIN